MKAKIVMRARKTSAMTAAGASQAMKANKTSAMKAAGASTTNKNGKTKKAVPRRCMYFFRRTKLHGFAGSQDRPEPKGFLVHGQVALQAAEAGGARASPCMD